MTSMDRPPLFLKRLSDVFDDEIARLAEEYGDRVAAQEIAESDHKLLRFYLPRYCQDLCNYDTISEMAA